ncbi:hypothetical protein [Alkalinema sp. FACHB-956]|uniref:hypothetical protein n=1 Tax=Alkalinema sp. FACHB-956 TaxID=2692768 RepID=UPI001683ADF8|nr:hypothetical protein [Alkalinema sp. FACHB-956]MBD2330151.1 hypothetical protein [Alkalinema sp. FACHB-956]
MVLNLLAVFVVLLTILIFYWAYQAYQKTWMSYTPVDYLQTSKENRSPWRWRQPSPKLGIPFNTSHRPGVHDEPNVSSLVFHPIFLSADVLSPLSGMALIGFDLVLILNSQISGNNFIFAFLIYSFLFYLGLYFFRYGDRVLKINLYPDRLEIVAKFAIVFTRKAIYKRDEIISINSKIQSFWTLGKGQTQPDYKLIIGRSLGGVFQLDRTFRLRCDPTQGSWTIGGLKHWKSL